MKKQIMWKNYCLSIIPNDDIYQYIQSCYLEVHIVLPQGYTLPFQPKIQKR